MVSTKIVGLIFVSICNFGFAQCGPDQVSLNEILDDEKKSVEGPFTIEDLESSNMIEIRETGEVKPFGYANEKWEEPKAQLRVEDKIYFTTHRVPRNTNKKRFL